MRAAILCLSCLLGCARLGPSEPAKTLVPEVEMPIQKAAVDEASDSDVSTDIDDDVSVGLVDVPSMDISGDDIPELPSTKAEASTAKIGDDSENKEKSESVAAEGEEENDPIDDEALQAAIMAAIEAGKTKDVNDLEVESNIQKLMATLDRDIESYDFPINLQWKDEAELRTLGIPFTNGPDHIPNPGRIFSAMGIGSRNRDLDNQDKVSSYTSKITITEDFREFVQKTSAAGYDVGFLSRANVGRGYPNQDTYMVKLMERGIDEVTGTITPSLSVIAVFDGHGLYGDVMSGLARERMNQLIEENFHENSWKLPQPITSKSKRDRAASPRAVAIRSRLDSIYQNVQHYIEQQLQEKLKIIGFETEAQRDRAHSFIQRFTSDGATSVMAIIDHVDEILYVANTGDSPAWVKYSDENKLSKISNDHNMSSAAERKRVHDAAVEAGYKVQKLDRVNDDSGGVVMVQYVPAEESKTQLVPFYAYHQVIWSGEEKRLLHTDYRINGLQLSRSFGHVASHYNRLMAESFVLAVPEIYLVDIRESPIDFVLLSSDGLTQPFEFTLQNVAEQKSKQDPNCPIFVTEAFAQWHAGNETVSQQYEDSQEKFAAALDEVVDETIYDIIRDIYQKPVEAVEALFEESRRRYKMVSSRHFDDVSIVMMSAHKRASFTPGETSISELEDFRAKEDATSTTTTTETPSEVPAKKTGFLGLW